VRSSSSGGLRRQSTLPWSGERIRNSDTLSCGDVLSAGPEPANESLVLQVLAMWVGRQGLRDSSRSPTRHPSTFDMTRALAGTGGGEA
jgi:hypothetical protein